MRTSSVCAGVAASAALAFLSCSDLSSDPRPSPVAPGSAGSPGAASGVEPSDLQAGAGPLTTLAWFHAAVDPVAGELRLTLVPGDVEVAPDFAELERRERETAGMAGPGEASDARFAVRDFALCDESDYITVQDGMAGSGPPDSMEVVTPAATLRQDAACDPLWNPLFDPPLFCADVTVRSFYTSLVLEQVYAEILSMSDTNHLGWNSDSEPDPGNPPSAAWGLWAFGDVQVVGAAPANEVTVTWIFERNNDTFYSFSGRVVGAAAEICDGADNDCDGSIDEGLAVNYYPDVDGDSFGDMLAPPTFTCSPPPLHVADSSDCDDSDLAVNPMAMDIVGDEEDSNCDGLEFCYNDLDDDGYRTGGFSMSVDLDCTDAGEARDWEPGVDCDDVDASVNPGGFEVCDGADNDCAGGPDDGVCVCGNAIAEFWVGEACDDGNTTSGDGCSAVCLVEPPPCNNGSFTDCNVVGQTLIPSSAWIDPSPPGAGWVQCAGFVNTAGNDIGHDWMENCLGATGLRVRVWNSGGSMTDDAWAFGSGFTWSGFNSWAAWSGGFTGELAGPNLFRGTNGNNLCGAGIGGPGPHKMIGANGVSTILADGGASDSQELFEQTGCPTQSDRLDFRIAIFRQ